MTDEAESTPPSSTPQTVLTSERSSLRSLSPGKVVETIQVLKQRIEERFPGSSLGNVAGELHGISKDAVVRAENILRPAWWLRLAISAVILAMLALLYEIVISLKIGENVLQAEQFAQLLDSSLASLVVIGAALAFLISIEVRMKRNRALSAIRELRSLAHIVDMHQLTKDPERVTGRGMSTESSPKRTMTPFELTRYLDYCSELLSLISKIGAIYVQDFPDTVALEAVDQLSTLTNGLSRSIWQKIMIVDNVRPGSGA